MYKIYIKDTLLVLIDSKDLKKTKATMGNELVAKYTGKKKYLLNFIDKAEKDSKCNCIIIHSEDYKKLWKDFKSLFKIVKAAGGLVLNKKKKGLLIYRRGFWDLPKGKMEPGEKKMESAVREVEEETGATDLFIEGKLATTYHTYKYKINKRVLKKTYWYLMHTTANKLLPQAEEDIELAEWRDLDKFLTDKDLLVHENIRELISYYVNAVRV